MICSESDPCSEMPNSHQSHTVGRLRMTDGSLSPVRQSYPSPGHGDDGPDAESPSLPTSMADVHRACRELNLRQIKARIDVSL